MTNDKSSTWLLITASVLVFLAFFRPIFEVGRFLYRSDSMIVWAVAGGALGLTLAAFAYAEIRANGVRRAGDAALFLSAVAAGVLFGASLYASTWANHIWSARPPASFEFIQPPFDVGFSFVYVVFNSFLELTIVLALLLNWRVPGRKFVILGLTIVYLAMRIWTYAYFLPNVLDFLSTATDGPPSPELKARADEWVYLSYYRTAIDGIAHALLVALVFVPSVGRAAPAR